ncbi:probable ADP-ribosylation factor GTPase-activating protein AGD14 [Hibiscus syriacus]|uniref:probable ADP-ribosylation factor GTPase-activating protein AGD14 n=1 Tax=Hibiscus syriacus TaxID=106335 RepID=UPI0019225391|nr:probable ADP-ribosylation factor GTPase-activating protein AGD14 [Hibiscus syriacus]
MKGKVEEHEKNEKIIRSLMKLPSNLRCINCNSQGPQYVCTNFWTFVCSTCGGIHREFSHRVKSVSMSTFTAEDVKGLREGGNEHAKQVYFKELDSRHRSLPDNCNVEGLGKFIKHVYVDRRYSGEKSTVDRPSISKKDDREDSFTNHNGLRNMLSSEILKKLSVERFGFSGRCDERDSGNRNSYDERRNLGNGKESQKHDDHKRISTYFEVVDDRFGDDISGTPKTYNLQRRLSNQHTALYSSRPREVCSLRDILDRIPSLRLSEALKDGDRPSPMQRTESTTKPRHSDAHYTEPRSLNSMGNETHTLENPANISSEPGPSSKQSPKSSSHFFSKPASSPCSNNPASIDCPTPRSRAKVASNAKNLDSVAPAVKPMDIVSKEPSTGGVLTAEILNIPRTPSSGGVSPATQLSNVSTSSTTSTFPSPKVSLISAFSSLATSNVGSSTNTNRMKQEKDTPHPQCYIFSDTAIQSTSPVPSSSPNVQPSQFVPQNIPQAISGVVMESLSSVHKEFQVSQGTGPSHIPDSAPIEQKSSERKELPEVN